MKTQEKVSSEYQKPEVKSYSEAELAASIDAYGSIAQGGNP